MVTYQVILQTNVPPVQLLVRVAEHLQLAILATLRVPLFVARGGADAFAYARDGGRGDGAAG